MRVVLAILMVLLFAVPSGSTNFCAECLEYECSFTYGGQNPEDDVTVCYETGEVIYAGEFCIAVCEFGQWDLRCN